MFVNTAVLMTLIFDMRRWVIATWRLLSLSKGCLGLAGQEQVAGAGPNVFVVLTSGASGLCR